MTVALPCGLEWGALPQQRKAMLVSASVPGDAGGELAVHERAGAGGVTEAEGVG